MASESTKKVKHKETQNNSSIYIHDIRHWQNFTENNEAKQQSIVHTGNPKEMVFLKILICCELQISLYIRKQNLPFSISLRLMLVSHSGHSQTNVTFQFTNRLFQFNKINKKSFFQPIKLRNRLFLPIKQNVPTMITQSTTRSLLFCYILSFVVTYTSGDAREIKL